MQLWYGPAQTLSIACAQRARRPLVKAERQTPGRFQVHAQFASSKKPPSPLSSARGDNCLHQLCHIGVPKAALQRSPTLPWRGGGGDSNSCPRKGKGE